MEVTGTADDELIAYLDDILDGLKYGDGVYSLVSLPDTTYQNNLDEQIEYWEKLKTEIISVRENGYEDTAHSDTPLRVFRLKKRFHLLRFILKE